MLTSSQLATLRAACFADPEAAVFFQAPGDASGLLAYLNADTSPPLVVWRSSVGRVEIQQDNFDWTQLEALTEGAARVWSDLFVDGVINPSKLNVRVGIDSVWKDSAESLAVRDTIYAHCKRTASRAEKAFSTGVGSDEDPANVSDEITVSSLDAALLIYKDDGTIWTKQG